MKPNWITLGRFGRVHGIKGLIRVHSYTDPRENILNYHNWHAYINKQWQALKLSKVELTSKSILVGIEGIHEREQAASLTNVEIGIIKEQLPALDSGEYYWHQLIGLEVRNLENQQLGKVSEMLATGSNDVLIVQGEQRHLIPYLPERTIISVDIARNIIIVDWGMDF